MYKPLREAAGRGGTFQCHPLTPSEEQSTSLSFYRCLYQIFTEAYRSFQMGQTRAKGALPRTGGGASEQQVPNTGA
jgi:hypothetical protein